jgi:hypothetical protein
LKILSEDQIISEVYRIILRREILDLSQLSAENRSVELSLVHIDVAHFSVLISGPEDHEYQNCYDEKHFTFLSLIKKGRAMLSPKI